MFARALPAVFTVALFGAGVAAQSQRAIIVTVLDQKGAPVKGVAAADLAVSEDGAMREVVVVKPATEPMTIASATF